MTKTDAKRIGLGILLVLSVALIIGGLKGNPAYLVAGIAGIIFGAKQWKRLSPTYDNDKYRY